MAKRKKKPAGKPTKKLSPEMSDWGTEIVRKHIRERFFELVNKPTGTNASHLETDGPSASHP